MWKTIVTFLMFYSRSFRNSWYIEKLVFRKFSPQLSTFPSLKEKGSVSLPGAWSDSHLKECGLSQAIFNMTLCHILPMVNRFEKYLLETRSGGCFGDSFREHLDPEKPSSVGWGCRINRLYLCRRVRTHHTQ